MVLLSTHNICFGWEIRKLILNISFLNNALGIKYWGAKLLIISSDSVLTYVLGAQKNRLIEMVLLSTHNICFGWEIRKLILNISFLNNALGIKYWGAKLLIISSDSVLTYVLGAQKNRLIEMVLLSTHNICFGWEIRKLVFDNWLLSGGLDIKASWERGISSGSTLFAKTTTKIQREKNTFHLKMISYNYDPSIYTMNLPKFIVSNQREKCIKGLETQMIKALGLKNHFFMLNSTEHEISTAHKN